MGAPCEPCAVNPFRSFHACPMPIRLKCPCGQLSTVPDNAGGKKTRCPSCQTLLLVPVLPAPAKPAIDPFADLPVTQPTRQPLVPAARLQPVRRPATRPAKQGTSGGGLLAAMIAGLVVGALGLGGAAVWVLMPMFRGGQRVEDQFEPLAPIASSVAAGQSPGAKSDSSPPSAGGPVGRNAEESAMLAVAQQFVRHARQNEHHEAVAMIDTKLFHSRLYSPKGSYEAMTNDIPAAKLLKNFGGYALDGAPVGGRRHWDVLGTSVFDGSPGVVVRYYVEPQSPLEALIEPKLFNRLGAMVTYDQVSQKASNLFTSDGQKTSQFDQYRLEMHPIRNAFPSRAGYMMLVFDCQEATPRLVDLVNVLGQSPLSRTGAHVFLADYRMIGGFGPRERYGTIPSIATIYGVSDGSKGASWDANDPAAEQRVKQQAAEEAAAVEQKRPRRLEKLVELWRREDPSLEAELSAFRSDFPGDLGFELAIVLAKMAPPTPTFTAADEARIIPAAKALYQQWRDPFLLYVEGLCALQNGRQADADALFAQCTAAGFTTTEHYMSRIRSAVDRADSAAIVATLEEWDRAVATDELTPVPESLAKLARRYEELEESINPAPTLGEMMASGRRGPMGSRGGRPGSMSDRVGGSSDTTQFADPTGGAGPSPQASGEPRSQRYNMGPPPGFGPPPGSGPPPGFGARPGQPPTPSGPQVVLRVTSSRAFDGNEIFKTLANRLGTQNYNFSQSGQTATMNLSFGGPLQAVIRAIDFGAVDSSDEATRTILVTIP